MHPHTKQQIEAFNIEETEKEWMDNFYESEWTVDTLELTELEVAIIRQLTSFLPRHMDVYDWNLPYSEAIILIIRQELKKHLCTPTQNNG